MKKSIVYRIRAMSTGDVVRAGSFGGDFSMETVNRLVNAHFDVKVLPSGTAVFVDKNGLMVNLSINVGPQWTNKGEVALREWRKAQAALKAEEEARREEQERELEDLMAGMSHEEIVRRLRSEGSPR